MLPVVIDAEEDQAEDGKPSHDNEGFPRAPHQHRVDCLVDAPGENTEQRQRDQGNQNRCQAAGQIHTTAALNRQPCRKD